MSRLRRLAFLFGTMIGAARGQGKRERIVEEGSPSPRAELVVVALLLLSAVFAVGFIVVLATGRWPHRTQYEGIALGGALGFMAIALILVGKQLVVSEQLSEEYPEAEHPQEQAEVLQALITEYEHVERIDLSDVDTIDSSGLFALVQADTRMRINGVRLTLIPPRESVARIFEWTGLDARLSFLATA